MVINKSLTLVKYKDTMRRCIKMIYPNANSAEINKAIEYSINKRYKEEPCTLENSYTKKSANSTLLAMADYIASREPIVTAYGTMFKKHETIPNPLGKVVNDFLELRGIHKKEMFKYPKGSEMFERFNLLQSLN